MSHNANDRPEHVTLLLKAVNVLREVLPQHGYIIIVEPLPLHSANPAVLSNMTHHDDIKKTLALAFALFDAAGVDKGVVVEHVKNEDRNGKLN